MAKNDLTFFGLPISKRFRPNDSYLSLCHQSQKSFNLEENQVVKRKFSSHLLQKHILSHLSLLPLFPSIGFSTATSLTPSSPSRFYPGSDVNNRNRDGIGNVRYRSTSKNVGEKYIENSLSQPIHQSF